MPTQPIAVPTVHLNGTGKKGLQDQLERVIRSLDASVKAMREAMPHGRDYYVQDVGAYERARDQHLDRMKRVQAIQDEYQAIYDKLS